LSRLWLLQDHLDSLKAVLLVREFSTNDVVEHFTVLPRLIPQVVEHLFWSEVISVHFLSVHEALSDRKKLVFAHFDHLGQFALLLIETGIILLLLSQL